jgi:hypothetical protein
LFGGSLGQGIVGAFDVLPKGRIELANVNIGPHDLTDQITQKVGFRNQLELMVVLSAKIVPIMGEATEAVMNRNDLEGLVRERIQQISEILGPDMPDVVQVYVVENSRTQIPGLLEILPESDDHLIVLGNEACCGDISFVYDPTKLRYDLRLVITAPSHLTDDHAINRVNGVCPK